MDDVSKNEIVARMEYILSYLLSKRHNANIKITFKKENTTNGNGNKTGSITKE